MRFEWRDRQLEDLQRWLACLGSLLLIVAVLAWIHMSGTSVCLFHRLTGVPCLTCGATRAAALLLRGDVSGAVRLQPLATLGGVIVGVALAVYSAALVVGRRAVRVRLEAREVRMLWITLLILAVLNWIYLVRSGV